jgi:pimeloyl-ACP methyl ester carboxylesterase
MPRVLLHGHPETAEIWRPLAEHFDPAPTLLRLPGYGVHRPSGFTVTKEAYVEWLIEELEAFGEPVDLFGHDWGGLLAVRVATQRPDLLVSWGCDAAIGCFREGHQWHGAAQIWQTPEQGEAAVAGALASSDQDAIEALGKAGVPPEAAVTIRRGWDATLWECALALYRSSVDITEEWGPDLAKAGERPGLVVLPLNDETMKAEWVRAAAKACRARLVTLEGQGHWWFLQQPAAAAGIVQEFWRTVSAAGARG